MGETLSVASALYFTKDQFKVAMKDYWTSIVISGASVACGAVMALTTDVGVRILPSLAALVILTATLALWAMVSMRDYFRQGFPGATVRPFNR